jgi:hypothetical protein
VQSWAETIGSTCGVPAVRQAEVVAALAEGARCRLWTWLSARRSVELRSHVAPASFPTCEPGAAEEQTTLPYGYSI